MPRNFDRRFELLFPVLDPEAKRAVMAELEVQLRDDVNAFELKSDGTQEPRWGGRVDCQRQDRHDVSLSQVPAGSAGAITTSGSGELSA